MVPDSFSGGRLINSNKWQNLWELWYEDSSGWSWYIEHKPAVFSLYFSRDYLLSETSLALQKPYIAAVMTLKAPDIAQLCHVVKQGCERVCRCFAGFCSCLFTCLLPVCLYICQRGWCQRERRKDSDINQGFHQVLVSPRVEFQPVGRCRYNLIYGWLPASVHSWRKTHTLPVNFTPVVHLSCSLQY